jgi:hypothetical protein
MGEQIPDTIIFFRGILQLQDCPVLFERDWPGLLKNFQRKMIVIEKICSGENNHGSILPEEPGSGSAI